MAAVDTGDGFKKYKVKDHFKPSELKHKDFGEKEIGKGGNKVDADKKGKGGKY